MRLAAQAMALPENQKAIEEQKEWSLFSVQYRAAKKRYDALKSIDDKLFQMESQQLESLTDTAKHLGQAGLYTGQDLENALSRLYSKNQPDLVGKMLEAISRELKRIIEMNNIEEMNRRIAGIVRKEKEAENAFKEYYGKERMNIINEMVRLKLFLYGMRSYGKRFTGEFKEDYIKNEVAPLMKILERQNRIILEILLLEIDINDTSIGFTQPQLMNINQYVATNSQEFAARGIAKIAMTQLWDGTFFSPTLTGEFINALERMRFNGKRVLGHMTDRYRVGIELAMQGHDPIAIQEILSTDLLILDGIRYDFRTGSGYRITGVPKLEGRTK